MRGSRIAASASISRHTGLRASARPWAIGRSTIYRSVISPHRALLHLSCGAMGACQGIGSSFKGLLSAVARGYLCKLPPDHRKPIRAATTPQPLINYA